MLIGLVPTNVVRRRKDEIYEVMDELERIFGEENGSSWPYSRKNCVEWTCLHFGAQNLEDPDLRPKLTTLVQAWNPQWRD